MITDYNMPICDGFELVSLIRKTYSRNEMAIIGLSTETSSDLSVGFLKLGANDFILKTFAEEEFIARVTQNIEFIEYVEKLQDAAIRDHLTKLYNRRYFFDYGEKIYKKASTKKKPISIAMVDIDFFKRINDTYGHDAGDLALTTFSGLLKNAIHADNKDHILARFGGEEFCAMILNKDKNQSFQLFERIRQVVSELTITHKKNRINFTISVGISENTEKRLDDAIKRADQMLYQAKETGRNQTIISPD